MATKTIEILNDLVKINNDRIEGYEKAIKDAATLDIDLKSIFQSLISETQQYKNQLISVVKSFGEAPAEGTTVSGKIYRIWMDIKAAVSSNERTSLLESCETGEDAWKKAYEAALKSEDLTPEAHELLQTQYTSQQKAHDLIKTHRDAQLALH